MSEGLDINKIKRQRKTKIIATLGPASNSREMIKSLFVAGVDVFRLNMSHGDYADKENLIKHIRAVEKEFDHPIAIMADLQGPKLRIATFKKGPVELKVGAKFTLYLGTEPGDIKRVGMPHKEIFAALEVGTDVLLNDGKVRLRVDGLSKEHADCTVMVGGELNDRKGVNIPNVTLPLAALTAKDRKDLSFAVSKGVDWIALSFVQRAADVAEARRLIGGKAAVMAKIEKPAAVENLDEIIELADGVMVARGDLGVEEAVENVPGIQKQIIKAARRAGKPVVVATQMLESMIYAPVPTRAEVSDVATAVGDMADAVMLSAESAMGDYPVEAVNVMDRVARRVEDDFDYVMTSTDIENASYFSTEDAISSSARLVGGALGAKAIVTFTTSGATARRAARERPEPPILVLTPSFKVARKMAMVWGTHTVKTKDVINFEEMIGKSKRMAIRHGFAKAGDRLVVTAGVPFGTPGATNVLHIAFVTDKEFEGSTED